MTNSSTTKPTAIISPHTMLVMDFMMLDTSVIMTFRTEIYICLMTCKPLTTMNMPCSETTDTMNMPYSETTDTMNMPCSETTDTMNMPCSETTDTMNMLCLETTDTMNMLCSETMDTTPTSLKIFTTKYLTTMMHITPMST